MALKKAVVAEATAPEPEVVAVVEPEVAAVVVVEPALEVAAAVVVAPEPTPEVAAEAAAEPEVAKKPKSELVTVLNLTHTYFVQPSTKIRIAGKEQIEMKDDGWLENQINAKLLKRV
jgi:hypothetical protein